MHRILLVDDDPVLTKLLKRSLFYEGYSVIVAGSDEESLVLAREYPPDLVLLDIQLFGANSVELVRRLRMVDPDLPIIVLIPKDAIADLVQGLENGADDVIAKPFTYAVLLARMRTVLRQHANRPAIYTFSDLTIDTISHHVRRGQHTIELTCLEFKLLQIFLEYPQQVLSKKTLLDWVWRNDIRRSVNVVEVYIKQLRQKLESNGAPRLLYTIRGSGYILRQAGPPVTQEV